MNKDFPRILSLLRKERKITQKEAADELGVAQALLSHYEKGKRECGLDFLVKAADYYNVSTDYLLGRSPIRSGKMISESDIPESSATEKSNSGNNDIMSTLNKKLITNSVEVIFSFLGKIKNSKLTQSISNMLMLSVYRAFRITYSANPENDRNIFEISENSAPYLINSAVSIDNAEAYSIISDGCENAPSITTDILEQEYDKQAAALLNLVKNSEKRIQKIS